MLFKNFSLCTLSKKSIGTILIKLQNAAIEQKLHS